MYTPQFVCILAFNTSLVSTGKILEVRDGAGLVPLDLRRRDALHARLLLVAAVFVQYRLEFHLAEEENTLVGKRVACYVGSK